MDVDYYRRGAQQAVGEWLEQNLTNTIARSYVWNAVNVALDHYENELTQDSETRPGWVVMLGERPVLAVNTKRQAKQQRRFLQRFYPAKGYRIVSTQLAVD